MIVIMTDNISSNLANTKPEPLNHCRWLTAANRILRLYATKADLEKKLLIFNHFCDESLWLNVVYYQM